MFLDSFILMRGIAKKKKKKRREEKYGGLKTSDETALRTLKTPFLNFFIYFYFSVLFLAFDNNFLPFRFSSLGRMIDPKICMQI